MTITFTVERPLSINRMYGRGRGRRLFITEEGAAFKDRVRHAATVAKAGSAWPRDLYLVGTAELSYQLYDYRGDTDGPRKAMRDCLEGILYVKDKRVQDGRAPLPIMDGKGSRVVVTVEIIELRDSAEAAKLRSKDEKNILSRIVRSKPRKSKKKAA